MSSMFDGAKAFDQDLTAWNDRLQDGVKHDGIFSNSAMTSEHIPAKLK